MKKYQAVAFLLSTAMTVSSVAPVFGASSDISGHWAESTITKWQNDGRIGGYEDGTFQPDKAITRAEFVRLLNSTVSTPEGGNIDFSDVKSGDWFYNDVAKAVGSNIASGFEDNTFRPSETVTRTQAAVFICNALKLTANESGASTFTDAADIPGWAKGAVGAVVSAGFLSGYPDGSFGANKGMTRAEAVSTLDRVLGGGSSNTPSGEIDTTDRDKQEQDDNKTAEAGTMVWKSGGSGSSSSKSSGGGGGGSSSSNSEYKNIVIRSQAQANNYSGKTLTGTTEIYITDKGIDLTNIKFDGNVDIYAQSSVAVGAAYDDGTAATAFGLGDIDVVFEGTTGVTGRIRVISNDYINTQVVIRTRVPKKISKFIAEVAAKIAGFEIETVETKAPIVVSEGASVDKIDAQTGSSVAVEESAAVESIVASGDVTDITLNGGTNTSVTVDNGATVENIAVNGDAKADVTVAGDGSVENIALNDNAQAGVTVEDNASVDKITLNDTSKADVAVKDGAAVDTIDSNSSASGTTISGTGDISNITANNPGTINKDEEVETPITPTKPDTPTEPSKPTNPSTPTEKFTVTAKSGVTNGKAKPGTNPEFETSGVIIAGSISWTVTSEPENANITISPGGVVTIPADTEDGTVITVTATSDSDTTVTGSTTITVEKAKTKTLTLSPATITLAKGSEATITATAKDQYGDDVTNITWSQEKADGTEYTPEGVFVAAESSVVKRIENDAATANETFYIKAKADEQEAKTTVNISATEATVGKVVVSPKTAELKAGSSTTTATFTAEPQTADGAKISAEKTITWSIDEEAKTAGCSITDGELTIGAYNDLTGTNTATITVTATCEGVSGEATVTVKAPAAAASVEITAPATEITAGDPAVTFTAKVVDQYGDEMAAEKSNVKWSLEGNTKAETKIDATSGELTVAAAEPAGKLTITATYGETNIKATKEITVKPAPKPVATVEVTPDAPEADLTAGKDVTIEFTATIKDSDGNAIAEADREVTWEVTGGKNSGTKFATASTTTDAKGIAKGTLTVSKDEEATVTSLTVTATCDTKEGTATVTVKPALPAATATAKMSTEGETTIDGKVDEEISIPCTIIIQIDIENNNKVVFSDQLKKDMDVTTWTNLPEGLTATISSTLDGSTTPDFILKISGTPKKVSSDTFTITIPGGYIIDQNDPKIVDVAKDIKADSEVTFNIVAADPAPNPGE